MERLTSIDGAGRNIIELKKFCDNDDWIISESKDKITIKISSKAINKLAEFEDFMEEQNIKDLDLLKSIIELAKKDRQTMQKYLSMWKKLKEFIITNKNSMFLNDMPTARMYLTKVLDRMQELENGE